MNCPAGCMYIIGMRDPLSSIIQPLFTHFQLQMIYATNIMKPARYVPPSSNATSVSQKTSLRMRQHLYLCKFHRSGNAQARGHMISLKSKYNCIGTVREVETLLFPKGGSAMMIASLRICVCCVETLWCGMKRGRSKGGFTAVRFRYCSQIL